MQQAKVLKAPQSDTLWGPQELGGAEVRGREGRGAVAAKGLLQGGAISSAEMMTPPPSTKSYEVGAQGAPPLPGAASEPQVSRFSACQCFLLHLGQYSALKNIATFGLFFRRAEMMPRKEPFSFLSGNLSSFR